MTRRIVSWVAVVVLAIAVAAPAFAHHEPEFGNLKQRVANQKERIVDLESYVLDLNARNLRNSSPSASGGLSQLVAHPGSGSPRPLGDLPPPRDRRGDLWLESQPKVRQESE